MNTRSKIGLVLAGFIAALMSSIDSGLNSVSTLFTMDFYQKMYPEKSNKAQACWIRRRRR